MTDRQRDRQTAAVAHAVCAMSWLLSAASLSVSWAALSARSRRRRRSCTTMITHSTHASSTMPTSGHTAAIRPVHTHTHPFNGPLSGTTRVSWYQKGKTNLDFTEARDSEWQWHQLGRMQVCISLQTDNHASTPPLCFLQARCPSCHPTNSIKALKVLYIHTPALSHPSSTQLHTHTHSTHASSMMPTNGHTAAIRPVHTPTHNRSPPSLLLNCPVRQRL